MHSHVQLCIAMHGGGRLGHVCSSTFMDSHVQLCIAMHGGGRLGYVRSSTFMDSHVELCIATHGGRRLSCMVIGPYIFMYAKLYIDNLTIHPCVSLNKNVYSIFYL